MNSSTSSSDGRVRCKAVAVVLLGLAVVFGGLEAVTRLLLIPHSRDLVRFAAYPELAADLCNRPGLRVAFVGNSATQCGVNAEQFTESLTHSQNAPVYAGMFLADGSTVSTWRYMVNDLFWRRGQTPDYIIVNFFNANLQDGGSFEIGRMAQYFTSNDDWDELRTVELPNLAGQAEYLLSAHWATFAFRDRIKKRALSALVPDYKGFAEELNRAEHQLEKTLQPNKACKYQSLERFLAAGVEHRTKIVFVAFPTNPLATSEPYRLDPGAQTLIRSAGMDCIDLRRVPGLTGELYDDDIHLKKTGADIYTRHLAQAVAPVLAVNAAVSLHSSE